MSYEDYWTLQTLIWEHIEANIYKKSRRNAEPNQMNLFMSYGASALSL